MLQITIKTQEQYNEETCEFIAPKEYHLQLEHSLVSISKWESKWHKPFLGKDDKTTEETIDYVKCMTITQNIDPEAYQNLSDGNVTEIQNYINDSMTATTINNIDNRQSNKEIMTNELIYYYMFTAGIPKECEKWHINRLITLIGVFGVKNQPPKKMSKRDVMSRNAALNAERRKKLNSKG